MWHVSIANINRGTGRPLTLLEWVRRERETIREAALRLLRGVGTFPIWVHAGQTALHVRRPLSDSELALCHAACPAFATATPIHAGGGTLIETIEA